MFSTAVFSMLWIWGSLISALFLPPIAATTASTSTTRVSTVSISTARASTSPVPVSPQTHQPPDPLVVDTFDDVASNAMGFWHGAIENLGVTHGRGFFELHPKNPDQAFTTQFSPATCFNLVPYGNYYIHIVYSGTSKFGITLNQNNEFCDPDLIPYPETWDTVEASRYMAGETDLYVPLSHFHINHTRAVSMSFGGFYTGENVTLSNIEIVAKIPDGFVVPEKVPSGRLSLRCSRPGSFAFGIDDGKPQLAQEVMDILDEENILVTFFVVGAGLRDPETNFTAVYKEMLKKGHQVALHSDTHQQLEALKSTDEIDDEILMNLKALKTYLGIDSRYFRPPYGTLGARTRQQLAQHIKDPQIINWSVDIEDWLWAKSETPDRQRDAFYRDVLQGGNLAVMHFLDPSTVKYFRDLIQFVKKTNATIMRIDQCLEDPESPLLELYDVDLEDDLEDEPEDEVED